jgi:D-3-phosphoglycerate dehydrogenase / 2-oxoglutarate reductase
MYKVLITTVPFGQNNKSPLEKLVSADMEYVINPLGRKLKESELAEMIDGFDILIAGTEHISAKVLERATKLKLIARVGIGLDNLDLLEARRRGIQVTYTPDAPAPAVAELTIGLMLSLLRSIHLSNDDLHNQKWTRYFGRRISNCSVGIVGAGRIGSRVIRHLQALGVNQVLAYDRDENVQSNFDKNVEWVSKETVYQESDIISIHVPLDHRTRNMIGCKELLSMRSNALLINASRGGIINENDLAYVLNSGHLGGAAIDVFETEPYKGELVNISRCLLTAHMGSMSLDCREKMEDEATDEAVRFSLDEKLKCTVPIEEYEVQELDINNG